jgi:hypothetical protein
MSCFKGLHKFTSFGGILRPNALSSLSLQHHAVMMTFFSRSTIVEHLPAGTIYHSWQARQGFWERAGGDTY